MTDYADAIRYALQAFAEAPPFRRVTTEPPARPVFIAGHPRAALDWARANPDPDGRPCPYRLVQHAHQLQGHRAGTLVLVHDHHHRSDPDVVAMAEHRGIRVVIG